MSQHPSLTVVAHLAGGVLFLLTLLLALSVQAGQAGSEPHALHLNLKAGGLLSPEGHGDPDHPPVQVRATSHWSNDGDESRFKGNWTPLGAWTTAPVRFDLNLSQLRLHLFWVEDPADKNFDARPELRWLLRVDGELVANLTEGNADLDGDGYHDGIGLCDQTREEPCHHLYNASLENLTLRRGQRLGLELSMRSFQSLYLLYDTLGRESGLTVTTNATRFFDSFITNDSVGFEYVEAWPTNASFALSSDFIQLFSGLEPVRNAEQPPGYPRVEAGGHHLVEGSDLGARRITWYYQGEQPRVAFAYTAPASTMYHPYLFDLPELEGYQDLTEPTRSEGGWDWWQLLLGGLLLLLLFVLVIYGVGRYDNR